MKNESQMPDAELDVMAALWKLGQATASQLRESLQEKRPLAHTSVCTLLKRLEARGVVTREKGPVGKAFVYRPAVKPTGTRRRLLTDLVDRLFGGSGVSLVVSLFESRPPTHAEIDQLQELLQNFREQSHDNSKRKGRGGSHE